jgi:hypothetical protein
VKKKFNKILGVALTVAMLASLFVFAAPVAAAEGNMQWLAQPLPTNAFFVLGNGVDVTDLAIASDGTTIYAIDGQAGRCNAVTFLYKSLDGGHSFAQTTGFPAGGGGNAPRRIAVAPDDPNAIAVIEAAAGANLVHVSNDGGITWFTLPPFAAPSAGSNAVDIKVGPKRSGALAREYLVALQSPVPPAFLGGSLQIIGQTTNWQVIQGGVSNYFACAFSPNYAGDHTLVAISDNATTMYNVPNQPAVPAVVAGYPVAFNAANLGVNNLVAADLALPSDFDPSATTGQRAWLSYASAVPAPNNGGVYRVSGGLMSPELGMAGYQIQSIAYSGTISGGILFAGQTAAVGGVAVTTQVWNTTQPTSNLPVWNPSSKAPTGLGGVAWVRLSPNYGADKTVYCGTAGAESALSISKDAGVSFDQIALIDQGAITVNAVDSINLTPDGNSLFVLSRSVITNNESLWKTATPPSPTGWSRIYCYGTTALADLSTINYLSWATAPEIYIVDPQTAGGTLAFYTSYDGGATFNIKSVPAANTVAITVESSKTLYIGIGPNVYKSTSGGLVWSSAVPSNVGAPIISVVAAGGGVVLVGGTGACSRSTDGGTSFVQLPTAGLTANGFIVIPDENYATNKIVYAGDIAAAGVVYRINADTGVIWENLANPAATAIVGMGMSNGAFYAQSGAAGAIVCDRTLGPRDAVGTITWAANGMNVPAIGATIIRFDVAQNKVYVSNGVAATLWAYNDTLATVKTTITLPVSGSMVSVDPVTGRAESLMVTWNAIGSGTGLANNYTFMIYKTAQGPGSALFIPTGALAGPQVTSPRSMIWPYEVSPFVGVLAPDIAYTFVAGVEYTIMIRANNEVSGDFIVSPFSDGVTFTVEAATGVITPPYAGPQLQAPQLGGTGVAIKPAFAWAPMSGVITWDFEISKSSALNADGTYTTPVKSLIGASALTTNSWSCDIDLEYSTPYVWHVQGTNATGGKTIWGIGSFTTKAAEVFTCPIDGLTFPTQAALEAHNAVAHAPTTPLYVWVIVIIGAVLVITVIVLIVTTRRTPSP